MAAAAPHPFVAATKAAPHPELAGGGTELSVSNWETGKLVLAFGWRSGFTAAVNWQEYERL